MTLWVIWRVHSAVYIIHHFHTVTAEDAAVMKASMIVKLMELRVLLQPMKLSTSDSDNEVIVTSVGFADRKASLQAAVEFDTDKAIAELYAHVAQMPDSAQKHRLMKQVNSIVCCICLLWPTVVNSGTRTLWTVDKVKYWVITYKNKSSSLAGHLSFIIFASDVETLKWLFS